MNKDFVISIVIGAIIFLVLYIGHKLLKKKTTNDLTRCLRETRYNDYEKLLNKPLTKYFFSAYERAYMRLTGALHMDNRRYIDECFAAFENTRMKSKDKEDIICKAFNYYISIDNHKMAKKYYDYSKDMYNKAAKRDIAIVYDTYVEKGYKYLDEYLKDEAIMPDELKTVYYAMLAQMFDNKGDKKMAKEYNKKALEYQKHLEESIVQQLDEENQ